MADPHSDPSLPTHRVWAVLFPGAHHLVGLHPWVLLVSSQDIASPRA
jgi:hypothetical protein